MRRLLLLLTAFSVGCHGRHDSTGVVVISAADLNVDGYADVVIGAPYHDGGGSSGADRGAVFIHWGTSGGPSTTPALTLYGAEDGGRFGWSVAFVGDVNGDGRPDLIVGAPLDDGDANTTNESTDKGRAFIFYGGPSMDTTVDLTMTSSEPAAQFGYSVSRAGDVNVNGYDDWLVGAPFDDGDGNTVDNSTDYGRAFLFFGGASPNTTEDVTYTGAEASSRFGWVVSSAGDINAGGADDVAVGAPLDDAAGGSGANRGRVYVFYGGTSPDATADLTLSGSEDAAEFGSALAHGLDVNGNGYSDLLVGAPKFDSSSISDSGRAYVFYGGTSVDTSADITISGTEAGGQLGSSVSRAGDVNGDGSLDFIVGAPLEDGGGTERGRAHLFFGGSSVDSTSDMTFTGSEDAARFGGTVAGFGDSNGGGRDVYIGSRLDDTDGVSSDSGADRGRVFIFYGGSGTLDTTADITFNGAQDDAEFGTGLGN